MGNKYSLQEENGVQFQICPACDGKMFKGDEVITDKGITVHAECVKKNNDCINLDWMLNVIINKD